MYTNTPMNVNKDLLIKTESVLTESSFIINKGYLAELNQYQVQPIFNKELNIGLDVSLFKVGRIVLDNKQSVLESLTAAYTALGTAGFTVFLYLNSNGKHTSLYIGVRGLPNKIQGSNAGQLLSETFKGHFPGSSLDKVSSPDVTELLSNLDRSKVSSNLKTAAVTAVSNVPSLAVEDRDYFMQGLERFIDASEGREYQAIILAEPVSKNNLDFIRLGYEQIATQLSPLLKQQMTYGEQESESVGISIGRTLSESLGTSLGLTETKGTNESKSHGKTHTIGTSSSVSSPAAFSKMASLGAPAVGATLGALFLGPLGAVVGSQIGSATASLVNQQRTEGTSKSRGTTDTTTRGSSISHSVNHTQTVTETRGTTNSESLNKTLGSNKQITIESTNKGIEQLLQKIDKNLERVEAANCYGGWNTAAYFIGNDLSSSEAIASIFLGLMRGQNSSTEDFALTTWEASNNELPNVLRWLKNLSHPRLSARFFSNLNIDYLTPATLVSGQEMAVQLSLPRKSTSGTAVIQTQSFGRQIQYLDGSIRETRKERTLELGRIRHLWMDRAQKVKLSLDQLTSHMFVTGSTGSGKSNTVYGLLQQLRKNQIPFLVIEPAKGEYKRVFGNQDDVSVWGTNPKICNLLKIDPFSFPPSIHVLEHIDRLVEIFNVCWPMYAAMPAVLKEAILEAYKESGWLLDQSTNSIGKDIFPSFIDVKHALERVIIASSFSEEVKSNYIGSLVTRINSLTNGLNGQIFVSNEIPSKELFNQNCIIDLSRVGSSETKSLIMGILLIRLNEYRMDEGHMNAPLRHVTVLEEAHNILKATIAQGQEGGASLESKSVEMITNSIAEMRTYGEGFIIVDQSPGAVDISAIRNTNTKIVMRLPEEYDRRIAGKSIGLKDEQIDEISKLPTGVALVSQNNWLEPVLCQINKAEYSETEFQYDTENEGINFKELNTQLMHFLLKGRADCLPMVDYRLLINGIEKLSIPIGLKLELHKSLDKRVFRFWGENNFGLLAKFIVDYLDCREEIENMINHAEDFSVLNENLQLFVKKHFGDISETLSLAIQQCLLKDFSLRGNVNLEIYSAWHAYHTDKKVNV